jgi:hypothetical protein
MSVQKKAIAMQPIVFTQTIKGCPHPVMIRAGAAGTWPLAARAQQAERMRRIGLLIPFAEDNPVGQPGSRP